MAGLPRIIRDIMSLSKSNGKTLETKSGAAEEKIDRPEQYTPSDIVANRYLRKSLHKAQIKSKIIDNP